MEEGFFDLYEDIMLRGMRSAAATNTHVHSFTCHTGTAGKIGCRLGMGRMLRLIPTGALQLLEAEWGPFPGPRSGL